MKVVQITAASVDDDDNWMSGHSHPIKRLRRQAITPTSAFLVCLLLLLASSAFDLAESAATGAGSSSCGSTGETESNGVAIVGGGSPQRESRSAQEAESLAAAQRSLLRMLPKSEKPRCRWQAEDCNPYTARCCQGMRCANYMGGFCMASYEKCICFPAHGPEDSN